MNFMRYFMVLLARLFLSGIFLVSGAMKMMHWQETEKELVKVLSDWQVALSFSTAAQITLSNMMAWAPLLLMLATLLELLGGLLLLFGVKEKLGAFLLILFLIPVTFVFHQFWFLEGSAYDLQIAFFFRNVAIMGGLIMVVIHGAHGTMGEKDRFSFE